MYHNGRHVKPYDLSIDHIYEVGLLIDQAAAFSGGGVATSICAGIFDAVEIPSEIVPCFILCSDAHPGIGPFHREIWLVALYVSPSGPI